MDRYKAGNGLAGASKRRHGAEGDDLEIPVPLGTRIVEVRDASEGSQQTIESQLEARKRVTTRSGKTLDSAADLEVVKEFFKFKADYVPQADRIEMLWERMPQIRPLEEPLCIDLLTDGERLRVAKGGRGGYGNPHFVSPTIPGPSIAGKGLKGTAITLEIELKTLADAGLVGLPNAGKS